MSVSTSRRRATFLRRTAQWLRTPPVRRITRSVLVLVLGLIAVDSAAALGWHPEDLWDYRATVLLAAVALLVGPTLPLSTLLGIGVIVSLPTWHFDVPELRVVPLVIATYLCAQWSGRTRTTFLVSTVSGVLASFSGAVTSVLSGAEPSVDELIALTDPSQHLMSVAFVVVAAMFGLAMRRLRRSATDLHDRNRELVALQNAERERAIAGERVAISREVHDVVAHHVAAIVVQAQAAQRVADRHPTELPLALTRIESSGTEALSAMRRVVGVLRDRAAGNDDLGEAIRKVAVSIRRAGIDVVLSVADSVTVGSSVQLAIVRVVQESLTNVLLHSQASEARVSLWSSDGLIMLEISDQGPPRTRTSDDHPQSGGFGIPGMRERASYVGGSLVAGSNDSSGWTVCMTIPTSTGGAP